MCSYTHSYLLAFLSLAAGIHFAGAQDLGDRAVEVSRTGSSIGSGEQPSRYGSYEYLEQQGIYKDITLGESLDDLGGALSSIGSSAINSINRFAGWSSRNTIGDLTWSVGGGLGSVNTRPFAGASWGLGYGGSAPGYFSLNAGPLRVDQLYAGYGLIYNDINGTSGLSPIVGEDDRIGDIVWLTARTSFILGNSLAISIQPMIYWLPQTGKVGWAVPGPFAGFIFPPLIGGGALATVIWRKQLANWNFLLYDTLLPSIPQFGLWDVMGGAGASWGDLTPIDRVGHYALGVGAPARIQNYDPSARFGGGANQWDGATGFINLAGFRAYGHHGSHLRSLFYLDRVNVWDSQFHYILESLQGGAMLRRDGDLTSTWAGYNFISAKPYDNIIHSAIVGASTRFSPSFMAYTQGGYFWVTSPQGVGDEGWLGLLGVKQNLGYHTSHWAEVGRRVFNPANSRPGIEDYYEYRLSHQLGLKTFVSVFAGLSQRRQDFAVENDFVIKYQGTQISTQLTDRTFSFAGAAHEDIEIESNSQRFERFSYRAGVNHAITDDVQSYFLYQYDVFRGSMHFTEHFAILGVTKRF